MAYGVGIHLIKGVPVERPPHIIPSSDHLSFEVRLRRGGRAAASRLVTHVGRGAGGGGSHAMPACLSFQLGPYVPAVAPCCLAPGGDGSKRTLSHPTHHRRRVQADCISDVEQRLLAAGIPHKTNVFVEDGYRVSQVGRRPRVVCGLRLSR